MRWEFYDKNPITTVRQSAKQRRATDVFTVEELKALLRQSKESTA
jgi:site-specific recombinase XerD